MDETNLNWDDLRLFLEVARHRGLAAASKKTGKSAPTLGRRMLALERHLNQDLFRRLARGYELTDQGQQLLAKITSLENQITPIETAGKGTQLRQVKISAGTWVTHLLCTKITDIIADNPVSLRFISTDQTVDIARRHAVIGIRNQRPDQIGLAGRKIAKVQFAVYGMNDTVTNWANVISATPSAQWAKHEIGDKSSIEVTSPRTALDLALVGAVRTVLPTFIGDTYDALTRLTAPIDELDHDQWLVTHQDDRFFPEVRRTIDRIYDTLKHALR